MNALHIVGESCFDGWPGPSQLKTTPYSELDGRFFWWVNRFVVGQTTFDVGFGDREFLVETMMFYAGIKDHFAPWLLLSAAGIPNPQALSGNVWVLEPDFMIQTVGEIAEGLHAHWSVIRSPVPILLDRARTLLGKQMLFNQEEQRRRDRDRACIQASLAFHAGRFAEAKRLLEPFRADAGLPASSAKILDMAERKLR